MWFKHGQLCHICHYQSTLQKCTFMEPGNAILVHSSLQLPNINTKLLMQTHITSIFLKNQIDLELKLT